MLPHRGYILICDDIEAKADEIKEQLHPNRVVLFVKEKFLVEDAKEAIAEAYLSEEQLKYLIIGGVEFNVYSQNALLKILEEPPKNIVFILLAPSKSVLLPTIRSRLPIQSALEKKERKRLSIDLKRLDLPTVFAFLQEHKSITKNEAKELVETLYETALHQEVRLGAAQLENFDTAYRLLELNARVGSVLSLLLMGFLHEN